MRLQSGVLGCVVLSIVVCEPACDVLLQLDKTYTGAQTMGAETVGHTLLSLLVHVQTTACV